MGRVELYHSKPVISNILFDGMNQGTGVQSPLPWFEESLKGIHAVGSCKYMKYFWNNSGDKNIAINLFFRKAVTLYTYDYYEISVAFCSLWWVIEATILYFYLVEDYKNDRIIYFFMSSIINMVLKSKLDIFYYPNHGTITNKTEYDW